MTSQMRLSQSMGHMASFCGTLLFKTLICCFFIIPEKSKWKWGLLPDTDLSFNLAGQVGFSFFCEVFFDLCFDQNYAILDFFLRTPQCGRGRNYD